MITSDNTVNEIIIAHKESIQVGKLRHRFIPPVCYSQSQQSISSNNQSYGANVVFCVDKVGILSTCIPSLITTHLMAYTGWTVGDKTILYFIGRMKQFLNGKVKFVVVCCKSLVNTHKLWQERMQIADKYISITMYHLEYNTLQ